VQACLTATFDVGPEDEGEKEREDAKEGQETKKETYARIACLG
jgi:hypothetical protein